MGSLWSAEPIDNLREGQTRYDKKHNKWVYITGLNIKTACYRKSEGAFTDIYMMNRKDIAKQYPKIDNQLAEEEEHEGCNCFFD